MQFLMFYTVPFSETILSLDQTGIKEWWFDPKGKLLKSPHPDSAITGCTNLSNKHQLSSLSLHLQNKGGKQWMVNEAIWEVPSSSAF